MCAGSKLYISLSTFDFVLIRLAQLLPQSDHDHRRDCDREDIRPGSRPENAGNAKKHRCDQGKHDQQHIPKHRKRRRGAAAL